MTAEPETLLALAERLREIATHLSPVPEYSDEVLALHHAATALEGAAAEIERMRGGVEKAKQADRYGVALMMISAGCSSPARFAQNILDDRPVVEIDIEDELP